MKLLAVGLSEREAAAFSILASVAVRGAQVAHAASAAQTSNQPADLYVVDLRGVGLPRWSAAAEAQLLQLLHGKSAVLLHAATEHSWQDMHAAGSATQNLVWLAKPYSTEAMRQALSDAQKPPKRGPGHTQRGPTHTRRESNPAASRPARIGGDLGLGGTGAKRAPVARDLFVPTARAAEGFGPADLHALLETFPDLQNTPTLVRLAQELAEGQIADVRLNLQSSLLMHPRAGWAATNAPHVNLARLCANHESVRALSVRPMQLDDAQDWGRRVATWRGSLDSLMWSLADVVLTHAPLRVRGDVEIRLIGFPDFTRLPQAPDLYVQLAAICVRAPQAMSALCAALPHERPEAIRRFVLLAGLSGLARLTPLNAVDSPARAAHAPARVQPAVRAPAPHVKRGFFKAMLAKLF